MISSLLNKKILIEKGVVNSSAVMSPTLGYSPYMETWANVYVRSANAIFSENEELVFTTEFTIRYNSKSKGINNKYRIKYNEQYYRIIEIIETESKHTIKIIAEHYYGE